MPGVCSCSISTRPRGSPRLNSISRTYTRGASPTFRSGWSRNGTTPFGRNARLAVIHAFFHYAAYRHPEHSALIPQVLAIPFKCYDQLHIDFLTTTETDALLAVVDRSTWVGRRDYALLVLVLQTGLRVSELTQLTVGDVDLGPGAAVRCQGKGRKRRVTPLTPATAAILKAWQAELPGAANQPLFPTVRRGPMSTDAVQWLLTKYGKMPTHSCDSLAHKHLTPHVLRHTRAMNLLTSGVDITVIALWLGHVFRPPRSMSTQT